VTAAAPYNGLTGATALAYDNAGNLCTLGSQSITWDVWGRLATEGNVSCSYDALGRRVCVTTAGTPVYYLYDGGTVLCELNASGNVATSYTWGALGLISDCVQGQSRYYQFDALGDTRALFSSSGANLGRYAWNAWGTAFFASGPTLDYGWKGRFGNYYDFGSGLVHIGERYYCPNLARFITRDPAGLDGGINPYAYCGGDPVDMVDVDGQYWHIIIGAAVGGLIGGGMAYLHGRSIWKGALAGAIGGAVGAATFNPELFAAGLGMDCL
jgi:RHS repeat-associated protein